MRSLYPILAVSLFITSLFYATFFLDATSDEALDERHPLYLTLMATLNLVSSIVLFLVLTTQALPMLEDEPVHRNPPTMSVTVMQSLMETLRNIDRMATNDQISKEDTILKIRQDLCNLMQILISEPHRTSFSIPAPVDFLMDSFIVSKTLPEIQQCLQENLTRPPAETTAD